MNKESTVSINSSPFGLGLFAKRTFKKNEPVFQFSGHIISIAECVALDEKRCGDTLQIDRDKYLYVHSPWVFTNHSCEPNCGILPDLQCIALIDIKEGQELFFDYSTTMLERNWEMDCKCNSPFCRKVIGDFDTLPKDIQQKYIALNIVQPFILNHIYDPKQLNI